MKDSYFFGFDTYLKSSVDWFFNVNHLFLILFVLGIVLVSLFLFHAKSEKGKKITKISIASILLVLEVGRTIYAYKQHLYNGGNASTFNWWWEISFQMCAIMTWTTIATLITSAFAKKDNKFIQFMYNILFGCAMIGGILTFVYPDCLTANRPFLHFVNIQTVLVHSLLIFVPIYLIKIKEFTPEIKNIWKAGAGYVFIGCVSMTASILSGNNFAYALDFNLFELPIPYPWHILVVLLVLITLASLIYLGFEIVRKIKNKNNQIENKEISEFSKLGNFDKAIIITSNIFAIVFGALIMLSIAFLINDTKTKLGLLCLIPLAYMILLLVFATYYQKAIANNYKNISNNTHIALITLTAIFALPVGILYLINFLNSKKALNSKKV